MCLFLFLTFIYDTCMLIFKVYFDVEKVTRCEYISVLRAVRFGLKYSYYSLLFFFTLAKLDRCPMCRAPINSYFCIRSEEYVPANVDTRAPKSKASINWIDALNDRLTDFLGFR
jgi:hypothetical protein